MSEEIYLWIFVIFAVLFIFLMLMFAWERMEYEFLKMKIKNMYKQMKRLVKEFEDEDMEAEEVVLHGISEDEKSPSKDDDKKDKT